MFVTMNVIVDGVLNELGLVPGSGVQTYTEPQIVSQVQTQFITLAEKRFWSHMMRNTVHNLDGIEGVPTTIFEGVRSFEDIEWVRYYPYEEYCELRKLRGAVYVAGMRESYDRIWPSEPLAPRLIRVFPNSFQHSIMVRARRWPTFPFTSETLVTFDSIALQHIVASNLLAKDGINTMEANRQFSLFDARYTDLINNEEGRVSYYGKNNEETFTVAES